MQRKELLEGVEQLDLAIGVQDEAALASLFATDAVLHQDGVFLDEDVWGQEAIVDWFKSQWDRYDCKHESVLVAGSDHVPANFSGCAFSFWQDKDMRVKPDKAKDLPDEAKDPVTTVGIWHPVYDHRLAIKHLYFMRQLPLDVAANKLRKPPPRTLPMDPASLVAEPISVGDKRTSRQLEMDVWTYNEMMQNADPDLANVCMALDVQVWQPLVENSFIGLDKYTDQLEDHYGKVWQPDGQYSHVAVTPNNIAFTFWLSFGKDKPTGAKGQLFGLALLGIRGDGKVQRLVEFRQLTSVEEAELIKEPYQSHRWDE